MPRKIIISITLLIFIATINASDDVRFIVFGDTQFGNPPEFERMAYEASLLRPDFVIQVGDLIHGYTYNKDQLRAEWARFKGQISLLNSPFYPVPGNHDIVTEEAEEIYADVWGKDKLLYSFDKGPAHIIVLNSWWGKDDDRIMEWQRNWLIEDLQKFKSKFTDQEFKTKSIFVFLHSPLWKYPEQHDGWKDWNLVHYILKEYPVKLVVGGHTHEHVWQQIDGINYLVINSSGVKNENIRGGNFSAFLQVVVKDNSDVEYAAIKAGSIFPLDTVDPIDRIEANKYNIEEKTILIDNWTPGEKMHKSVAVSLENNVDEQRLYRLNWYIPYESNINIIPESKWVLVPAQSSIIDTFIFTSNSAPSIELMPYLDISTTAKYRTGTLARNLEQKYRKGEINIYGYKPSIKLDDTFTYEGKYHLFLPPSISVKHLKGKVKIDGKFNENDWSNAETIVFGAEDSLTSSKTELKLIYDTNYLYIAAKMQEPLISHLKASAIGPIPLTWNDDDLELFFDTKKSQSDYIRLFQNSAGTRFNSLQRWVENKYFDSKYKSALYIGDDFWSLEMEIPWSDIDLEKGPSSGDEWAFNAGRHRQQAMIKETRWAGGLYDPQKYGILKFD